MSVRLHRGGWEVRWRDAAGRQRARRFPSEDAARAFDEAIAEVPPPRAKQTPPATDAAAVSTPTARPTRSVYRRSDGTQTTKRGFASERAARDASRRLIERAPAALFTMPIRTVKRSQGRWESAGVSRPLDRNTVSRDWH